MSALLPESTAEWLALVLLLAHIVLGATAVILISAKRRPSTAIAWMLTIIFIPLIGAIAFFLVGFSRLPRHRRYKQREVSERILERVDGIDRVSHRDEWPEWLGSMVTMTRTLGALPMVGGNSAKLTDDYDGSIRWMIEAIDEAQEYVHVEFYILTYDDTTAPFFAALERARERGVTVRVLSDHLATFMYPPRAETIGRFAAMGAEWHAMLPLRPLKGQWQRPDLRNHR
ncbi:MAG: PLDc N-terminal domain-containing protein, partial [Microcella sp.]